MLALKPQPTHTVWGNCFVCAGEMRIALIEPHPISDAVENLPCLCGRTRVYTVDLTERTGRVPECRDWQKEMP